MIHFRANIEGHGQLGQVYHVQDASVAGFSTGIITIDFNYVKLPSNVANATTFAFPVVYEDIVLEIEGLFNGEDKLLDVVIEAPKKLEKKGLRAIVGTCGYFNHFQEQVRDAVAVPVYLSSVLQIPLIKMGLKPDQKIAVLVADGAGANADFFAKVNASISDCIVLSSVLQIPLIKMGLKPDQKIAVLVADGAGANADFFAKVNASISDCIVKEIGSLESFAPIRYSKP